MGTEPIPEEIPVSLGSLPEDLQLAFSLYYKLPDRWEGMSGTYMGKDLSCFKAIADILEVENIKISLDFVLLIDGARIEFLALKQKNKPKKGIDGV